MTSPMLANTPSADMLRKGWCPGALRPMQTGDGLLVRLRLTGGVVPAPLARALAQAARRFGNGAFDLSARANLQMRGVSEATLDPLIAELRSLRVLDEDPDGEAVRNVIASPLAGLDRSAVLDVSPVVAALEARLASDPALHALPGKFGFLVDDGGLTALSDIASDVRFEAFAAPDGPCFAVAAGGDSALATPVTVCAPAEAHDVAARLAEAFLRLCGGGAVAHRRMASLVRAIGGAALAQAAGLPPLARPLPHRAPPDVLGARRDDRGDLPWLGVGAEFGRWTADDLEALADVAARHGNGELRLTPWRAILLPGVDAGPATAALAGSGRFITSADDPRLAVVACAGAPACSSGQAPTRDLALALAGAARRLAASGVTLHVSGCAKGCARPQATAVTLTGHDGSYDLVLHGKAGDAAVRRGMPAQAAKAAVEELASKADATNERLMV